MSRNRDKTLQTEFSQLAASSPETVIENFRILASQIENFDISKTERDKLFAQLENSFFQFYQSQEATFSAAQKQNLLLSFFEEFAAIRRTNHNILNAAGIENLSTLIDQINFENLSADELINLATNFDLIGCSQEQILKAETSQALLASGLRKFMAVEYKGVKWIKNATHFFLHCNNLGLFKPENAAQLMPILENISHFILSRQQYLGFSEVDSQASLDFLLYARHVLKLPINPDALSIIAKIAPQDKKTPSQPHREIFNKLVEFLRNKKGDHGQWQHPAKAASEKPEDQIIFGGVVLISMEESYFEIDGISVKKGDIVVRNLVSGEILLVIEIDGPSHFLSDKIKTGKTKGRNEVASAMLGAERFMTIDMQNFNLFRNLKQQASKDSKPSFEEIDFLQRIQDIIQIELDKIASEQASAKKPTAKPAPAATGETPATPAPAAAMAAASAAPPPQKTIAEIAAELQEKLWMLLKQGPAASHFLEKIEEILSDPIFTALAFEEIKDKTTNLNPFDYALEKFNLEKSQDGEKSETLEILLQLLWINGFENQKKELINPAISYPPSLNCALGKAAPAQAASTQATNLNSLLINARRGNFHLVKVALQRNGLPGEMDEKDKKHLIELTEIAIARKEKGDNYLLDFLQPQPWFAAIEKEVFIKALNDSNDKLVQFFLTEKKGKKIKFFLEIFHANKHLLPKIYDFKFWETTKKLEEKISKDDELVAAMPQAVAESASHFHVSYLERLHEILLQSSNEKSAEILLCKAIALANKADEKSLQKAEKLLKSACKLGSVDAKIILAQIYDDSDRVREAIPLWEELAALGSASAYFALSTIESDQTKKFALLDKAAELKQPRALGIKATMAFHELHRSFQRHEPEEQLKIKMAAIQSYILEAVALGDVESLANLGTFYLSGIFGAIDEEKKTMAFNLFKEAGEKGFSGGWLHLGECYQRGDGVAMDKIKAAKLYKLALKLYHPNEDPNIKELGELRLANVTAELNQAPSTSGISAKAAAAAASNTHGGHVAS